MAVLARDSLLRARLRMDAWLEQLLYIAADAAAMVRLSAMLAAAFVAGGGLMPGSSLRSTSGAGLC